MKQKKRFCVSTVCKSQPLVRESPDLNPYQFTWNELESFCILNGSLISWSCSVTMRTIAFWVTQRNFTVTITTQRTRRGHCLSLLLSSCLCDQLPEEYLQYSLYNSWGFPLSRGPCGKVNAAPGKRWFGHWLNLCCLSQQWSFHHEYLSHTYRNYLLKTYCLQIGFHILGLFYSLYGILHVLSMPMWVFSRFFGFHPPPQNVQLGGLATLKQNLLTYCPLCLQAFRAATKDFHSWRNAW